jgi:hypothetical protein
MKEKSKHTGLAQEIGCLLSKIAQFLVFLVRGAGKERSVSAQRVLTAAAPGCFSLLGGLLLVVPHVYAVPVSVFKSGLKIK